MSEFKYYEKDGKTYMDIGGRLHVLWNDRWVPASEEIVVLPSSIALSDETASLSPAGTKQLSAIFSPENTTDKSVEWSSSDEEIATVSEEGLVEAIAVGEAIITCVSVADPNLKAECVVTVAE